MKRTRKKTETIKTQQTTINDYFENPKIKLKVNN